MQKGKPKKKIHPANKQKKPGIENKMKEAPKFNSEVTDPGKKLIGKVALITGGDSGIGRAIAVTFAKNGADVAICYLSKEKKDAEKTKEIIKEFGTRCLLLPQNLNTEKHCKRIVQETIKAYKRLDILINNAGMHIPQKGIENITSRQLLETFNINVFSMFYIVKEALRYMQKGGSIINTASVTAYRGSAHLIDYSATKGAIVSFTRSLAASLIDEKIRVNAVAPGPVWTPLIVSSLKPREIETFGSDSPMGRAGQPVEIAPCYLFLASDESSYITGQVLHANGGEIVNG
ncbi:MAG TPA: SDR family oxidoreductase [Bacteroidia bacterium]|jgi:NAD(P)-dependent dehydrogenase (short-subunit alcohol dehydrogenase family)|nr:SDR family oxidoreductase [Bacteroidia bacterium]